MTGNDVVLTIKDWQSAIADSPHLGHALMRNLDIEAFPGAMKSRPIRTSYFVSTTLPQTFTANAATDVCTVPGNNIAPNYTAFAVTFTTTGTLPAGLSLNTVYFLIQVTGTTFKVASTWANANSSTAIDITDAGVGVHTVNAVPVGTINKTVNDPSNNNQYFIDSNGRVWFATSTVAYLLTGNNIGSASGLGLEIFQTSDASATYLFVFRNAVIDVINVTATSNLNTPTWVSSWQSLNTGSGTPNRHDSIVSATDNNIYFTDGRWLGMIHENAGQVFAPGTSATYTFSNQILKYPQNEIVQCIGELGTSVYVGGLIFNRVYPWDRISVSFNLPLLIPEAGVYQIKNAGSILYILAGTRGNIYTSQGTYTKFLKKVPDYMINNSTFVTPSPVTWGGIAIKDNGILFGLAGVTSANSGVYLLYPDGRIVLDSIPSIGATNGLTIFAKSDAYIVGYAGGADFQGGTRYSSGSLQSVYNSALFRVGDKTHKAGFSQIEVQIAQPVSSGQIRVSYRRDTISSFTILDTYVTDGATTSFQTDIGLNDIENIQIQVEFDGDVEIMQVLLNP